MNYSVPFKYQKQIVEFLQSKSKLWKWFDSSKYDEKESKELKDSLLKETYRLDYDEEKDKYSLASEALKKLNMSGNVIMYQAQNTYTANALIIPLNEEYHIIFSGQLLNILSNEELKSIIAHELGHIVFQRVEEGKFGVASRILRAITQNIQSDEAYIETARIFSLYEEIFCDRVSYFVSEDINTTITSLVKTSTGLNKVSSESYKKQANEIFNSEKTTKSKGITHPEIFVRVKSLMYFEEDNEDAEEHIKKIIESDILLSQLSIISRIEHINLIDKIIKFVLKPNWMKTDDHISLAQKFNPNIDITEDIRIDEEFIEKTRSLPQDIKKLICYILLDFAYADKEILDIALGHSYRIVEILKLEEDLDKIIKKEFALSQKALIEKKQKLTNALNEITESETESIYEQ